MARMITNSGHPLDHRGDARKGPQIAAKAMSPASSKQGILHGEELMRVQPWLAARPPGAAQGARPATPPFPIPTADTLATDPEVARNGCQNQLAGRKQASRLLAPPLQFMEISSWRKRCVHGHSIAIMQTIVTVLCEIQ